MNRFDFDAFKEAVESKNAARWASFYSLDAVWIEYRQTNPPRQPNVMNGHESISEFIRRVCSQQLQLTAENEIITDGRAAFRLIVTLPENKRIIEHIILDTADGKITRQVDVEAWD